MDKLQVEIGGKELNELVYGWDNTKTIFKNMDEGEIII